MNRIRKCLTGRRPESNEKAKILLVLDLRIFIFNILIFLLKNHTIETILLDSKWTQENEMCSLILKKFRVQCKKD